MKKKVFTIVLLFMTAVLFSQTASSDDYLYTLLEHGYTEGIGGKYFNYKNDVFILSVDDVPYKELIRSNAEIEHAQGLTYIDLPDAGQRLLCLANDIVFLLYDGENNEPYFMGFWSLGGSERIDPFQSTDFSASSELKEGAITYGAGNLASFNLKTPWVEGVDGNGIGEYVTFRMNFTYLYLFSGYISYDKPYLYEQNARPKKIKITVTDKGNSQEFIFDLEDTPNPQTLTFPDWMKGEAKLEILEVYPGTKYQDTCIHALLGRVF